MTADGILETKYPAKVHLEKVLAVFRGQQAEGDAVLYLEAQQTRMLEDSDMPEPFRQRRDFFYLTGCDLPDCAFIYSFKDQTTTLFIPDISPSSVIWSGLPISPTEALATYDVDSVNYMSTLTSYLSSLGGTVYAISNQYAHLPSTLQPSVTSLKSAIESCRVRKSPYEVALIRQANTTTNVAHTAVMRAARTAATERDLEALFINRCFLRDSPNQAYHSIVAAGTAAATLHYVNNRASLKDKLNLLLDAGAEYRNYASDVTRTFPINGKFTPQSRQIYDLVLKMQTETIAMLKADVLWEDVHIQAHRLAIAGLLELGILRNGTVEEILANRTSTAFFPHGLGHYLGLDTHDVGGHPNYEDKDPMFQYLRIRGKIPEDSVVTVEPGIYFCEFIIEPFLKDDKHGRFIDRAVLDGYWSVGGVRIEDNLLVTATGSDNLTTAPKGAEDMERLVTEGGVVASDIHRE